MAKVTTKDREDTGFPDGSYPVSTHAQRMSAIKLRGHSKTHSKEEVLNHVARAATKAKDITAKAAVANARAEDKRGG
jgi:hypothetical protein